MNESLIAIYMNPEFRLELSFLEKLVRTGGFQLQNRQTGDITLIDEVGDAHPIEAHSLAARISQLEDTQLQFWKLTWEGKYPGDLYCRVMFKTGAVVIEFGELPRDSDLLLKGIWTISRTLLDDEQIIGLVVDLPGATVDDADWYEFFVEGKAYGVPCPNLLCFKKNLEGSMLVSCQGHLRSTRIHHIVVHDEQMTKVLDEWQ